MDNTRKIEFEGISNARDLGGLKTRSGRRLKSGCLIRSANLSKATDRDIQILKDRYRLSCIIDLRTTMAAASKPDRPVGGAEYLHMPVFDDAMIGVTHESDRDYEHRKKKLPEMSGLYSMMMKTPSCLEKFRKILMLIMEHDFEKGSVLWHCSEGKDRCGLVSAFLLTALDVSEEQILGDYLLTNETAEPRAEWYYRKVLENGADEEVARSVRNAFVVKKEYLESALAVIRERSGDTERFLTDALDIPGKLIGEFREKLTEEGEKTC